MSKQEVQADNESVADQTLDNYVHKVCKHSVASRNTSYLSHTYILLHMLKDHCPCPIQLILNPPCVTIVRRNPITMVMIGPSMCHNSEGKTLLPW